MASLKTRMSQAIRKEFVRGKVYRVDVDRVDVVPLGSAGVLRGLPLTGNREKVKPGDMIRIFIVGGERVAIAEDVAVTEAIGEKPVDATEVLLAERLASQSSPVFQMLNGTGPSEAFEPISSAPLRTLAAPAIDTDPFGVRANHQVQGGGVITAAESGAIRWSGRMIVISAGRRLEYAPDGYFNIEMPPIGTALISVGGAASPRSVGIDGIPLLGWETLYYALPIGATARTDFGSFILSSFTAEQDIPATWVRLFSRNNDSGAIYGPNGLILRPGVSVDTRTYYSGIGSAHEHDWSQISGRPDCSTVSWTPSFTDFSTWNASGFWGRYGRSAGICFVEFGFQAISASNTGGSLNGKCTNFPFRIAAPGTVYEMTGNRLLGFGRSENGGNIFWFPKFNEISNTYVHVQWWAATGSP